MHIILCAICCVPSKLLCTLHAILSTICLAQNVFNKVLLSAIIGRDIYLPDDSDKEWTKAHSGLSIRYLLLTTSHYIYKVVSSKAHSGLSIRYSPAAKQQVDRILYTLYFVLCTLYFIL